MRRLLSRKALRETCFRKNCLFSYVPLCIRGETKLVQSHKSKFQTQNLMPLVFLGQGVNSLNDSIRPSHTTATLSGTGNPFKMKSCRGVQYQLIVAQAYGQISNRFRSGPLGCGVKLPLHVPGPTGAEFSTLNSGFCMGGRYWGC